MADPLADVTPLVLTFNEEANITRALKPLHWARRVVVVDSGSTDGTLEALRTFDNVEVFSREFTNHADQWAFGLDRIETAWVLTLDADYICSAELQTEIATRLSSGRASGYRARFKYCVYGRALRSTLYPPRIVLFRRSRGGYSQDGHTQRLDLEGPVEELSSPILHDDRKSLGRWIAAQTRYAKLEAAKLEGSSLADLRVEDKLRKTYLAPLLILPFTLFLKGVIFDGPRGWYYALQRTYAELLLSLHLLDERLRTRASRTTDS